MGLQAAATDVSKSVPQRETAQAAPGDSRVRPDFTHETERRSVTKREFYAKALLACVPVATTFHMLEENGDDKCEKIVNSTSDLAHRLTLALEAGMWIYDCEDSDPQRPSDYVPSTENLTGRGGANANN